MTTYKSVKYNFSGADLTSLPVETKPTVASVVPTIVTNDAQNIVITGTNYVATPRVEIINSATGIWYSSNSVTRDSATQLTVNLTLAVDAGTYRIRVENPDGNAGISATSFLTVSDAPAWTTGAGSLGNRSGGFSGTVATVAATGDTVAFSETTSVLTNASLANCALNSSTGVITTSDFDGPSTSGRTHTFTIRATDAQGQYVDREFTLSSVYAYDIDFLVVAGGGAGAGIQNAGGGGSGGYRISTETSVGEGIVITVTVGDGGASVTSGAGNTGGASQFSGSGLTTISSAGGGGGGHSAAVAGLAGGSGGGAGPYGTFGAGNVPSTSPVQGYAGGTAIQTGSWGAGGGGGASEAGNNATSAKGGDGGDGVASSISGSSITRGGGGGGGTDTTIGSGGAGGGGDAAPGSGGNGLPATVNTGGGGGGAEGVSESSGAGGKGVVILSVPDGGYSGTTTGSPTVATGQAGSKTTMVFTGTGSYTT